MDTHTTTDLKADLTQAFIHESAGYSTALLTKSEVCDGSVLLDPRNFEINSTCRVAVRRGLIKKFIRFTGVQYYSLTEKGFDVLFPAA